ncbi:MAG: GntR family transcriptional regulator [Clostridia bacterium]|nr:GntR family transcriptional regulator [Clostridia bacterium]
MNWNLDKDKPICPQICAAFVIRIAGGEFDPNERLISVRDLAIEAGVNPNTVQKAYEQLESSGIIYSVRGSGWYVGENTETAKRLVTEMIAEKTAMYIRDMRALGVEREEIIKYIKEADNG